MTIRVNIFYPNTEGGRFDLEYYLKTHIPMAIKKLGSTLKEVYVEHGVVVYNQELRQPIL